VLGFSLKTDRAPGHGSDYANIVSVMRVRIYSNGTEAPLTPFIAKFLANVCIAVTSSLKSPQPIKTLKYEIEANQVRLLVNELPVILDHRFSQIIVLDTIRGMIRHLKMADSNGSIRIEVETEAES
jgi:hypothetical protein